MVIQNLLSQLRHKGLRSSSAIRGAIICGAGTSRCKSTLLLPWSPNTQHFQTLTRFSPSTRSLLSGNSRRNPGYGEGNSLCRGGYRFNDLVLRPRRKPTFHKVFEGEAAERVMMQPAAAGVCRSLVCLSLLKDHKASGVFSGTVVRSDGIVATSADCLRHLKGNEYEIGVKVLGCSNTSMGVLLHTDFLSKIAFVKISCLHQIRVPKWEELGSLREGDRVVGAGCNRVYGNWKTAKYNWSLGFFSSIVDDKEKTESHKARTSGRLIKASCDIEKAGIGGALVSMCGEVLGIIQKARGCQIEATPIEDVLKCLEYFEKGEHAKDMEGLCL